MKTLRVVDMSGIMRAALYNPSLSNLSITKDGSEYFTGSMYSLLRILSQFPLSDHYVFCADRKGNARKEENQEYKASRVKAPDHYYAQYDKVIEILQSAGFTVVGGEGLEADDFVVEAVEKYKNEYDKVYIHCNDYDLAQCIDLNVAMVYKDRVISKNNYTEILSKSWKTHIPYNTAVLYKATVGDGSDELKGIVGFGPGKFANLIQSIEGKYDFETLRKNGLEREIIEASDYISGFKPNIVMFENEETIEISAKDQALDTLKLVLARKPVQEVAVSTDINFNVLLDDLSEYRMNSIIRAVKEAV